MQMKIGRFAVLALMGWFALASGTLHAATTTMTGEVGDAACGVKHMLKDAAACTAVCVSKGSAYSLIVKDKAYTLSATDAQKADLAKLAGKMATVTGDVNGDTITVAKIAMAKTK
jgi:hypothetical protein